MPRQPAHIKPTTVGEPVLASSRVVKRWDVNTVLSVNTNNRTTLDFLNNNKLNVWDFH